MARGFWTRPTEDSLYPPRRIQWVTSFVNIFSWSLGHLFVLMVSFAVQKLFILNRSHWFIFAFIFFGDRPEKVSSPHSQPRVEQANFQVGVGSHHEYLGAGWAPCVPQDHRTYQIAPNAGFHPIQRDSLPGQRGTGGCSPVSSSQHRPDDPGSCLCSLSPSCPLLPTSLSSNSCSWMQLLLACLAPFGVPEAWAQGTILFLLGPPLSSPALPSDSPGDLPFVHLLRLWPPALSFLRAFLQSRNQGSFLPPLLCESPAKVLPSPNTSSSFYLRSKSLPCKSPIYCPSRHPSLRGSQADDVTAPVSSWDTDRTPHYRRAPLWRSHPCPRRELTPTSALASRGLLSSAVPPPKYVPTLSPTVCISTIQTKAPATPPHAFLRAREHPEGSPANPPALSELLLMAAGSKDQTFC